MFDISGLLGMPVNASAHGHEIDYMMGLVHWLMLILFAIWTPFFIYTLVRFRQSRNPKASIAILIPWIVGESTCAPKHLSQAKTSPEITNNIIIIGKPLKIFFILLSRPVQWL